MGGDIANNPIVSTSPYLVDKYNEYSIQIIRWILKTISLWPRPADASIVAKIRSDFTIFICYLLLIAIVVPNILSTILDPDESYETKLHNIGPFIFCFIAMINYSCLLIHVDDINECVKHVKVDWLIIRRFEDQKVMLKSAKSGRFIAGFCAVFMHFGVLMYTLDRSFYTNILQMANGSSIVLRSLPQPFYNKILNAQLSPAYEIVFFLQCISSFVVSSVTIATCGLTAVFVMHACGQIKIMISWLENLVDNKNEERTTVKQRFAIIVNHHLRILSFVSRTEKIMNVICLMELTGTTIQLCLLAYYCIKDFIQDNYESVVSYIMLLFSLTVNIFIFCYIGEILSEQSEQIGKSAYMTNWYLLPGKTAQGIILIILRSNTTIKITAGKIVQLSFSTFGDVIKSSLAYFNILRTVMIT